MEVGPAPNISAKIPALIMEVGGESTTTVGVGGAAGVAGAEGFEGTAGTAVSAPPIGRFPTSDPVSRALAGTT